MSQSMLESGGEAGGAGAPAELLTPRQVAEALRQAGNLPELLDIAKDGIETVGLRSQALYDAIALCPDFEALARAIEEANELVRRSNSHHELVAALKECVALMYADNPADGWADALAAADAALAKVKGETGLDPDRWVRGAIRYGLADDERAARTMLADVWACGAEDWGADEALAIIDRLGEDVPPADPARPPDLAALRRLERGASVKTGGGFVEWAELAEGEYATRLIGELWALGKEDGDGS